MMWRGCFGVKAESLSGARTVARVRMAWCLVVALVAIALAAVMPFSHAQAKQGDLDEILDYTITVDVNEDATLHMVYHVDWKVLDSTSEGPLTWVRVGIPNKHYISLKALTPTIKSLSFSSSGGSYARIDLDRAYYAGEVASFDFELVQDYMYQVNRDNDGETVYEFTPGWFEDLDVDQLTIRWNDERVERIAPAALQDGGYYTWQTTLGHGKRYTVTIAYPNDAYAFDIEKTIEKSGSGFVSSSDSSGDGAFSIFGGLFVLFIWFWIMFGFVKTLVRGVTRLFGETSGFSAGKRITRTKVVYYPTCPGCGAGREEGKDTCAYCGRSLIQSEEKVSEEDIPPEEKAIKGKKTDGEYAYSTLPNTYLRVHVLPAPAPSRSSCAHSSCAHSSCACACGCACACACAGGGRAGCSAKDFYNTGLKLKQLESMQG